MLAQNFTGAKLEHNETLLIVRLRSGNSGAQYHDSADAAATVKNINT